MAKLVSLRGKCLETFPQMVVRFITIPRAMKSSKRGRERLRPSVSDSQPKKGYNESELLNPDFSKGDDAHWKHKLSQLNDFMKDLQKKVKLAEEMKKQEAHRQTLGLENEFVVSKIEEDASHVYKELSSSESNTLQIGGSEANDLSSIILSASQQVDSVLPKELVARINDDNLVLNSLLNSRNRNWNAIIDRLYRTTDRLKGIPKTEIHSKFLDNVKGLSFENIERLDKMLTESFGSGVEFDLGMYETIFINLSHLNPSRNDKQRIIQMMFKLIARYDAIKEQSNFTLSQKVLNSCLLFSKGISSFENMNAFLTKFKEDYGIYPNKHNYTMIIQFYVKSGLTEKAWAAFDTMKFLSLEHKPDVRTYNAVINICCKERNYAKAIDLFQEMNDFKVDPDEITYTSMAKTLAACSADSIVSEGKADSLRLMGWKYIHLLQNNFKTVNESKKTSYEYAAVEAMMALAAYDGDVAMARALYHRYITAVYKANLAKAQAYEEDKINYQRVWQKSLSPQLFNYLMLAYSKWSRGRLPILSGYEEGARLRHSILNSIDYLGRLDADEGIFTGLPMLPLAELFNESQILSESRAMWQFNLEFGGTVQLRSIPVQEAEIAFNSFARSANNFSEFKFKVMNQIAKWKMTLVNHRILNSSNLNTFLTIPLRLGDKKEFLLRFEEFVYQEQNLDKMLLQLYDSMKSLPEGEASIIRNNIESNISSFEKQMDPKIEYLASMKHKLLASSPIYELKIKLASKFRDIDLATTTWKERGDFRKSSPFQALSISERKHSDTRFACAMVEFFTSSGMYNDALAVVLSSQRHIKWTYSMVKPLHIELKRIEDTSSARKLLEVVNKKSPIQKIDDQIKNLL
ncbi:HER205Cp [Eremothecium sinecaudum]|uniref:Mitochondrial 15S rRNA processing factor CCM1 n=1 Tax=Eremothecium sinecaudum TaxID=45286 RepID=A0A109UZX5_9SACH|nr:HER205Cp [Eremothecium sinecaudum]AMD21483.1 HER205Cp [Eremothecium sinecaudum]